MICPLKFLKKSTLMERFECEKDKCAWWRGHCSITNNIMTLKIIHREDGVYDIYDKWLFSYSNADNVFSRLVEYGPIQIEFIDEY